MAAGTVSIRTGVSIQVSNPNQAINPEGADPQDTFGLVTEDFIIINGIPVVPDQVIRETPAITASGVIITDGLDFEAIDSTADFRLSARYNVGLSEWKPYLDNTWFGPKFTYDEPAAVDEVIWIRKKFLHRAQALNSRIMAMDDLQSDTGTFLFTLFPTGTVGFIFDTLYIELTNEQITIQSLEVQSIRKMPIGTDLVMLGISFSGIYCTIYIKNGDTPVVNTKVPTPSGMGPVLNVDGAAGVIAVDYWNNTFDMASQINATYNVISGAKRR